MAPHLRSGGGGGATGYVARKNGGELMPRASNDELIQLKVPVKKPTAANAHASRDQKKAGRRTTSHGADEAKQHEPFFATNSSIADQTTNSIETGHNQDHQPGQEYEADEEGDAEHSQGSGSESEDGDDEDGEGEEHPASDDLPNDPLKAQGQGRYKENGPKHTANPQLPYVKGDSYPEPSNDQSSIHERDPNRQNLDSAQAQSRYQYNPSTQLPARSGTRLPINHFKQVPPTRHHQQQQQPGHETGQPPQQPQGHESANVQGAFPYDLGNMMDHINDGFAFGNPRAQQMGRTQPPGGQPHPQGPPSNAINTNAAQAESTTDPYQQPKMDKHQRSAVDATRPNTPQQQGKQAPAKTKHRRKSGQSPPVPHAGHVEQEQRHVVNENRNRQHVPPPQMPLQMPQQMPQHMPQHMPQQRLQHRPQQRVQQTTQYEQPPMEPDLDLDYLPPHLYKMPYHELKGQSLDVDPKIGDFTFRDGEVVDTLQQKLEIIAREPQDVQANFFVTLDIDTWEEAGNWFLERFGALTKMLKETRREKRKAAQVLEDEIAERHNVVSKRQELTLTALGEMKQSGGKVLQGTPKKTRKTK